MSKQGKYCPVCNSEMLHVKSGPEKGMYICYPCAYGWTAKRLPPEPEEAEDGYYARLFSELAELGYFELAPYRIPSSKKMIWRLSWRVRRGCYHGWNDMKVFGSTPWDVMTQYHFWLNKQETEQDYFETNILPDSTSR